MNVVGIDPSLRATGFCNVAGSTFTVGADEGDERLVALWEAVGQLRTDVPARPADLAIVEDLPTHAHGAGKTGMTQGVVRLALLTMGLPYVTVTAGSLKKFATGRGTCSKSDMRMELYKRAGLDLPDDNQVDAWWLRQLGLAHCGLAEVKLPATHLVALSKVDWKGAPPP